MEKGNIVLVALLAAVIGVFGYALFGVLGSGSNAEAGGAAVQYGYESNTAPVASSSSGPFAARTSDEAQVSVDITPKKFEGGRLYFDIGVNTHSVDLSKFDLKRITVLETKSKKLYPESAPLLTGHHNSGQLVFIAEEEPKEYQIIITGLPVAGERVFSWP